MSQSTSQPVHPLILLLYIFCTLIMGKKSSDSKAANKLAKKEKQATKVSRVPAGMTLVQPSRSGSSIIDRYMD